MAAPIAGVMTSAAQVAQQKPQDPLAKAGKSGASKFDAALGKAEQAGQTNPTNQTQAADRARGVDKANQVDASRKVEDVSKLDKSSLKKLNTSADKSLPRSVDPITAKSEASRSTSALSKMIGDLEKGQGVMDKLIDAGTKGKSFSNGELLSLQAGMYKYTQELELTGKVVEKATSGLKETLKTQV